MPYMTCPFFTAKKMPYPVKYQMNPSKHSEVIRHTYPHTETANIEGVWVNDNKPPRVSNVGIRWRRMVSFKFWLLHPLYQLNRRLGRLERPFIHGGKLKKKSSVLAEFWPSRQSLSLFLTTLPHKCSSYRL